jgi:hypothetical protein
MLKGDNVTLLVTAEKDGKLQLGCLGQVNDALGCPLVGFLEPYLAPTLFAH